MITLKLLIAGGQANDVFRLIDLRLSICLLTSYYME